MPMDKKRYPKNWREIALKVKHSANWICQDCGKQCLKPNTQKGLSKSDKAKLTLTVHHIDYNPANSDTSNLIALCAPCHLLRHTYKKGNINQTQSTINKRGHNVLTNTK